MCGFAAAIGWAGAEAVVQAMIGGLIHRGDVTDPVVSPFAGAALGTRRLRIVDAEHGTQPAISANGRVLVSFNGEIYNHNELRHELACLGVQSKTSSDTEVIANALSTWGSSALTRFIGMYAFVALDLSNGDFIAARDPLGVKPLYVIQSGDGFLFCSEIKPLLSAVDVGDVLLVPPGHLLTKRHCLPFDTVFSNPMRIAWSSTEKLDLLLSRAVEIRIPPDLPFAIAFSGGIDSTLIAHYARQRRREAPGYFLGDTAAPDYNYAARYADKTGLDLRVVELPSVIESSIPLIEDVVQMAEGFEPSLIRGGFCNYVLARQMHVDGYRILLCGEGADELFAGYLPHELGFAASEEIGGYLRAQSLSMMNRDNLQRLDRGCMRFQVEAREPFLDPSIIRYALSCHPTALVKTVKGKPRGKMPLRYLYDLYPGELPVEIRDRRKVPLTEGSGLDVDQNTSPWLRHAEESISDHEFAEGRKRFKGFSLINKEELLYLSSLANGMDVFRVPHLLGRVFIDLPKFQGYESLSEYLIPAH